MRGDVRPHGAARAELVKAWNSYSYGRAYYLAGPNDVDWIFRNQLLSSREDGLYVDYVRYEDGAAWSTPAGRDVLGSVPDTAVQRLVIVLHRLG